MLRIFFFSLGDYYLELLLKTCLKTWKVSKVFYRNKKVSSPSRFSKRQGGGRGKGLNQNHRDEKLFPQRLNFRNKQQKKKDDFLKSSELI